MWKCDHRAYPEALRLSNDEGVMNEEGEQIV
jgi:hypothetical protein